MYCLLQLYMPVSKRLANHRPLLKLFAIKAVGESFTSNNAIGYFLALIFYLRRIRKKHKCSILDILAGNVSVSAQFLWYCQRRKLNFIGSASHYWSSYFSPDTIHVCLDFRDQGTMDTCWNFAGFSARTADDINIGIGAILETFEMMWVISYFKVLNATILI